MTRHALLILLLLPGWAGAAQWEKVASGPNSELYIDRGSATMAGPAHKVWTLNSFRSAQSTPDGTTYWSVKALNLYSCAERSATLQAQLFYPEPMGQGDPVLNYKYERFGPEDVVPDSLADNALAAVCKKRQ